MRQPLGDARRISLFISGDLAAGLKALKAEHGTPEAEAIRRALAAYLAERGVLPSAAEKVRAGRHAKGQSVSRTKGTK